MKVKMHQKEATQIKLQLLNEGIRFSTAFLAGYGAEFIEKRWAYGNSDAQKFNVRIPQEIYINDIIVAVHANMESRWELSYAENSYFLTCDNQFISEVTFPIRPKFYDTRLSNGLPCKSIGTLYGGGSLGIFALGTCYYFRIDKSCGFCSLEPTRSTHGDHIMLIKPEIATELTEIVLREDSKIIKQVMLNGGNRKSNDEGFRHHIATLEGITKAVSDAGLQDTVEVHLITMPPDSLKLLDMLDGLPVKIAINLEVFSPDLFSEIAPGKAETYGRDKLIRALEIAVDVLGYGNVYTIFVGGLEPVETLSEGIEFVSSRGVVPTINIFHQDPGTRLENHPKPSVSMMNEMGTLLQKAFVKHSFIPFYMNCGRNSIDTEAYLGLF